MKCLGELVCHSLIIVQTTQILFLSVERSPPQRSMYNWEEGVLCPASWAITVTAIQPDPHSRYSGRRVQEAARSPSNLSSLFSATAETTVAHFVDVYVPSLKKENSVCPSDHSIASPKVDSLVYLAWCSQPGCAGMCLV